MGYVKGYNLIICHPGSTYTAVAASKDCSFSIEREVIETAPQSAGWRNYIQGMKSWNVQASGLYSLNNVAGYIDKLIAGTQVTVGFMAADGDAEIYAGTAIITSIQASGSVDGIATYSIQLQGSGVLEKGSLSIDFSMFGSVNGGSSYSTDTSQTLASSTPRVRFNKPSAAVGSYHYKATFTRLLVVDTVQSVIEGNSTSTKTITSPLGNVAQSVSVEISCRAYANNFSKTKSIDFVTQAPVVEEIS